MIEEKYLRRLLGETLLSVSIDTNTVIPINEGGKKETPVLTTISNVLYFGNYQLRINNPATVLPANKKLHDLQGLEVISTEENGLKAEIIFNDASKIVIDLREEVYWDPEAMVLYGPDNFWVVWN